MLFLALLGGFVNHLVSGLNLRRELFEFFTERCDLVCHLGNLRVQLSNHILFMVFEISGGLSLIGTPILFVFVADIFIVQYTNHTIYHMFHRCLSFTSIGSSSSFKMIDMCDIIVRLFSQEGNMEKILQLDRLP